MLPWRPACCAESVQLTVGLIQLIYRICWSQLQLNTIKHFMYMGKAGGVHQCKRTETRDEKQQKRLKIRHSITLSLRVEQEV